MLEGVRNLYLLVAGDCNLTCAYCYAQRGSFGGSPSAMSPETLRTALERFVPTDGTLVVSFFGGEPLLELDLLRQAVAWGDALAAERQTGLRYVLTTNGTLLDDERLDFLKTHISHVAVSLDGCAELTDAGRRFKTGGESVYRTVRRNLQRLNQAGIPYGLRGTIQENRAGELETAFAHLEGLGAASLRVDAAAGAKPWRRENWRTWTDGVCRLNRADMDRLLAGEAPTRAIDIYRVAAHRLAGQKRHYPCLAGQGILAVSTGGDVYPCDHFVGKPSFRMGNVHEPGFPGEDYYRIAERLQFNRVSDRPKCAVCRVRHACGGECPALSLLRQGDIAEPSSSHCSHTRHVLGKLGTLVDAALADPVARERLTAFVKGE